MIQVTNLSFGYPQKDLFNHISFTIEESSHCVLIGASGSGKSSLIKLLLHQEDFLFDGKIEIDPTCRIGYVSQFSSEESSPDTRVFDFIAQPFLKLQAEIDQLCTAMATAEDIEPLLEQYQNALDAFNAIDGDHYESNIHKKLNLASLMPTRDQLVSELSGGELKLIQVIKEMLTHPNLLIMDEPDAFLDFDNLNSMRLLINAHKGMLLVVTHNRFLLEHCFNQLLHLENKALHVFDGKYTDYNFALLQEKTEQQELAEADNAEIMRNDLLIDKLRYIATYNSEASRGKSLKARVKVRERLVARKIHMPYVAIHQPSIDFSGRSQIADDTVLQVKDYSVAYDVICLQNVNFEIKATDKVAIIGKNGTGKTTLLRAIYQNQSPEIQLKEGLTTAYLAQQQDETLSGSNTLLDEMMTLGFKTTHEARAHLYTYGFTGETVDQKIASLSGGEKNMLQLAKISLSTGGLLLLDEPTSHLDTFLQMSLEEGIKTYKGAILMISHDFYTIVNTMDYVLLIEDKTIRRISMRRFKKMFYSQYFDHAHMEREKRKKIMEADIAKALQNTDFEKAKQLTSKLENLIKVQ